MHRSLVLGTKPSCIRTVQKISKEFYLSELQVISHLNVCSSFHSKLMGIGARQCLNTGPRKQQDYLLWILHQWTLEVQTRSLELILGLCASCKSRSGDALKRFLGLSWVTAEKISLVHTEHWTFLAPVARYLLCLPSDSWNQPLQKVFPDWALEIKKFNLTDNLTRLSINCCFKLRWQLLITP